jgi:predicted ATPase/DNA-binding SARP family transcriptional activator
VPRACFGILGPLEVQVSGRSVEIGARQLRRLVCVLLLVPGRPVPTDMVVECLWPDAGADVVRPDRPAKTLGIYASRLRQLLPEGTGPRWDVRGYRLDIGREDLDARQFEARLEAAPAIGDDPVGAAEILRGALRLWRGPALADCRDEHWTLGAVARLEELRLNARERLIDARMACGEESSLCGELDHLVGEHPLRERFWAQLMLALYRSGRQAEALRAYQRLRRVLGEELGIEPSHELSELEVSMRRQDAELGPRVLTRGGTRISAQSKDGEPVGVDLAETDHRLSVAQGQRGNLPTLLTSFVGRERELKEVGELARSHRLVTLTGPGGVGKTRLALRVADDLSASTDAAFLVDFAPIRDPSEVDPLVASVLGVKPPPGVSVREGVVSAVGNENLLLVLDNCEHLVSSCTDLCRVLLQSCAGLCLIATSRQPIGVDGEVLYRVPSLGLPAPGVSTLSDIAGEDSVRFFVQRAQAQQPSFRLDESNAAVVSAICRRLDGIPLALELGAARLRVLSLSQVNDLLVERFRLLRDERGRTRLPRHRTLSALIDWSYELLEEGERSLLRRLAVFSGGFDLDSVCALVGAHGDDQWGVLECLVSLVDKSLVQADSSGDTSHYSLLETIRQYALEKLLDAEGDEGLAMLRDAHALVYLDLAEQAAPMLISAAQFVWLDRLDLDFDNLRLAFSHLAGKSGAASSTRQAMRLLVALDTLFDWRGHISELMAFTAALERRAEAAAGDPLSVRFALMRLKLLARGDPTAAVVQLEQTLDDARRIGAEGLIALVLNRKAWLSWMTGDRAGSVLAHAEAVLAGRRSGEPTPLAIALAGAGASLRDRLEALELFEAAGDAFGQSITLCNLGATALDAGDSAGARAYCERALPTLEAAGLDASDPMVLLNLGTALVGEGEHRTARALYTRAIEIARRHNQERQLGYGLFGIGLCASRDGDLVTAATLYGAARLRFEKSHFAIGPAEQHVVEEDEACVRAGLGNEKFVAAVDRGRSLSRDDAIDLALGRLGPLMPARSGNPPVGR